MPSNVCVPSTQAWGNEPQPPSEEPYSQMSRAALRYAIEHLPIAQRKRPLKDFLPNVMRSAGTVTPSTNSLTGTVGTALGAHYDFVAANAFSIAPITSGESGVTAG